MINFVSPLDRSPLNLTENREAYVSQSGEHYPIVRGIPRFTAQSNYADSFGLQWNKFRETQLDSATRKPISENRLKRLLGGDLAVVKNRLVLEAGCGAGRFTEVLLRAGAKVHAFDLSLAVEANLKSCGGFSDYRICQADIARIPFPEKTFEYVLCIGVLQHTPDPEASIQALARMVGPGGDLVIDHYAPDYAMPISRRILRSVLLKMPSSFSMAACRILTAALWPIHVVTKRMAYGRPGRWLRRTWVAISPLVDYQDSYPELGSARLREWSLLDTHDTLTDRYKHLRSVEQIRQALESSGLHVVEIGYGGNGVEARAKRIASA